MVDHEGGRVVRFSSGVTRFPDAVTVGTTKKLEEVGRQGEVEAQELSRLGVDVNLAPCVDVLIEGADPVIGARSYGSDPRRVAALGAARIQGLQRRGVAACAKHFPGIGAVPKDPHTHLPTVGLEWSTMRQVHLAPFVEAIRIGVATIMSSHVCYPTLDPTPKTPATFSSRLMRGLLRGELGFQGVVLSDDLEMGALRELCSVSEAAVRAVEAGHDVLLVCSDLAAQREAFDALREAYRQGHLPPLELERSVERIDRLKEKFSNTKSP
jgi:beta-N-acetylhexosaminidase